MNNRMMWTGMLAGAVLMCGSYNAKAGDFVIALPGITISSQGIYLGSYTPCRARVTPPPPPKPKPPRHTRKYTPKPEPTGHTQKYTPPKPRKEEVNHRGNQGQWKPGKR